MPNKCQRALPHRHQRRVEERLARQSGGAGQRRRLRPPRARDRRHQQASERLLEDRDGSGGFPHSARFREGAELYDAAVAMAPKEVASHQTTWIQASRLLEKLAPSVEERALVQKPFEHVNR
jgi:hypothetical protein